MRNHRLNHRLNYKLNDVLNYLLKLGLAIALIGCISLSVPSIAWAAGDAGTQVFSVHCAGCHANGGNIVRRGKTLKLNALKRNQMDSIEAIAQIVAQGKNNMSAYRDRLTDSQIQAVAAYVLEQAQTGWQKAS